MDAENVELSRYALEKKLGTGGMAAVFRARDTLTGKMVAVKIIENTDDDKAREGRFEREVRAAGRLVHPNVCRILSWGRAPAKLFMAMELVEGRTMHEVIKVRGTLPVPVALEILKQLLAALACAHDAGVAHRDLKPANIMITTGGTVKLLDFGIAKGHEDKTVTATGLLIGTPAFMAPEQILGEGSDARSDLFSAGVTLLVMLTGRIRFNHMDPAKVMLKVSSEAVPSLLEECPAASSAVDRFLAKLCAMDPAERFQSAKDALRAMKAIAEVPVDGEGAGLLAMYLADPDRVAAELARTCAQSEMERADRLLQAGPAGHHAAALCLYKATLLEPSEAARRKLKSVCEAASLTFDPIDDPQITNAMVAYAKNPNAASALKKLAELYRGHGHVLLSAAFLTRYLRAKPGDAAAARALALMLDGPPPSAPAADVTVVLSTQTSLRVRPPTNVDVDPNAATIVLTSADFLKPPAPRPRQPLHPMVLVAIVVLAGIGMAFFGRFIRTVLDEGRAPAVSAPP